MECNTVLLLDEMDNKKQINARKRYYYSNIDKVRYDNDMWHEIKKLIEEKNRLNYIQCQIY